MGIFSSIVTFGIGVALIFLVAIVLWYVLSSIAHLRALKALGYDKAWLAWIPYGCYFACADAITSEEDTQVSILNKFSVPTMLFKLWWVALIIVPMLNLNSSLSSVVIFALQVVFLGHTYATMYALLDETSLEDNTVIGIVSSIIPFVVIYKLWKLSSQYDLG